MNRDRYSTDSLLELYIAMRDLFPAERVLFDRFDDRIAGSVLLDLGCGAGRATPYLADRAKRYVGLDFARNMIDHCRVRFADRPNARFVHADAAELTRFVHPGEFNVVLFLFNGLDSTDHEHRMRILAAIEQSLDADGLFIFSAHNRAFDGIVRRPNLTLSLRPRQLAMRLRHGVNWLRLRHRTLATDEYEIINDDAAGHSMLTYYVTVEQQLKQLRTSGFDVIAVYGNDGSEQRETDDFRASPYVYYVATKSAISDVSRVAPS